MDNAKVDEVLKDYAERLKIMQYQPVRWPAGQPLPPGDGTNELNHTAWMCQEALTFPAEKLEKKMRWLGFIQGVFFCEGFQSIEQLKRDNMPKGEEFKT